MRRFIGFLGVAGLLLSVAAIGFAADPPAKKDNKKADEVKDRISKLAEEIFAKADKHNHGFLNKIEFKRADNDLIANIDQLAKDGLIGRGRPARTGQETPDAKSAPPTFSGGFADADTDKDKKVTLAEFTDYVTRAINAADEALKEMAASQRRPTGGGSGYAGRGGRR